MISLTHSLKIKNMLLIAIAVFAVFSLTFFANASTASAVSEESKQAACEGLGSGGASNQGCGSGAGSTVSRMLSTVINILSWIVGIAAVIMIIVGGFKFIVSSGDSAGIASARSTIIYALIGLVVAAFAQLMVRFVLNKSIQASSYVPVEQVQMYNKA